MVYVGKLFGSASCSETVRKLFGSCSEAIWKPFGSYSEAVRKLFGICSGGLRRPNESDEKLEFSFAKCRYKLL